MFRFVSIGLLSFFLVGIIYLADNQPVKSRYEQFKAKKSRGPAPQPDDREWTRRTWPYGTYDADHLKNEISKSIFSHRMEKSTGMPAWEPIGPTNIGGRINAIRYNPKNPEIVYAGSATGGVLKSVDGGESWFPIFDDIGVLNIGDIAVDPLHPDTIYAGTGEPHGSHNNFAGGGLYKSVDAGKTWTYSGLEKSFSVGRIAIDPVNPNRIFVAAMGTTFEKDQNRGLFLSEDGGATWSLSIETPDSVGAVDVIIRPDNPQIVFACLWDRVRKTTSIKRYGPSSGIYKSVDGGKNWSRLGSGNGLPNSLVDRVGRIGLDIYPANNDIMAAVFTDGLSPSGVYKSEDGGENWSSIDLFGQVASGSSTFSWYFGQISFNPQNPNHLYVLDVALNETTDSGLNWSPDYWKTAHVDHHAITFNPKNNNEVLVGNDGGISKSTDGGNTFTKILNLPITQFYEIGLDVQNPERVYGGTQDNGTLRTPDGAVDSWEEIYGGDGFYVIVDPENPDVIYAESQYGYLGKSEDGGLNWIDGTNGIDFSEPTNWSTPVVMDPNYPEILYYGTKKVYQTYDGALNWTAISPDLCDNPESKPFGTVTTISVSPLNSDLIYAGTDNGSVWITEDGGGIWTKITNGLPMRWVMRLVADPFSDSVAYAAFSGLKWKDAESHVYKTSNRGKSWESISSNLPDFPVNALAVDPVTPGYLYIGTDYGPFYSSDDGKSWSKLGSGIPAVAVYDLKIHPVTHDLVAGTHGRSMYKLSLDELKTGVSVADKNEKPGSFTVEPAYPNPFNGAVSFRVNLAKPEVISATIYSVNGQKIATVFSGRMEKGERNLSWNARDASGKTVSSGVYLMVIESARKRVSQKVTLLK